MARGPAGGGGLSSYHGTPAVEVRFTRLGTTRSMCGESGQSFSNLLVEQFQEARDPRKRRNPVRPALPQDHIWELDA